MLAQVRSAQTLTLLSESLKLSLLLSKTPDPALNDEALALMESTEREKLKCAQLLAEMLGLDKGAAERLVGDMDKSYFDSKAGLTDDEVMEDVGGG